ncbi:Uncharacterised protein [uncultured archaeon]|nr:Uncharacterised protein [uncultured archaeon]
MKKIISLFLFIFIINFASAQNGLDDLLNSIEQSTVVFFSVFIISFVILFFSLSKTLFKENKSFAGIIAVTLSFLIVYGLNKSNFDVSNLFSNLGISGETLNLIIALVVIAGVIFMIVNLKKDSLFVLGGLFIVASFFVYAKTLLIVVGVILIGIRLFMKKGKGDKKK